MKDTHNMEYVHFITKDEQKILDYTLDSAVEYGSTFLVKSFLSLGVNPNGYDDSKYSTPLTKAITRKDLPMVKVLLEGGADINYTYKTMNKGISELTCGASETNNGMTGQEWLCDNFDSFPVCSGDDNGYSEFCCPAVL